MLNAFSLTHFTDFLVLVGPPLKLGRDGLGERRIVPITGGTAVGPHLSGTILPGGADEQLIREDGLTDIHARYVLQLPDGALVQVDSRGLRTGPPEVMQRLLAGDKVDPAQIHFATTIRFHATSAAHDGLNQRLFLARGIREPDCVRIRLFRAD